MRKCSFQGEHGRCELEPDHEEPHGIVKVVQFSGQSVIVPFESQVDLSKDWAKYQECLDRTIKHIEETGDGSLEARGDLIPSPNPEGSSPLMVVSYKRKDKAEWPPASYSGFDDDTGGYIEPMSAIYVETLHHVGCDICGKTDPPFLRMEGTRGDEEVSVDACLGCVRLALSEYDSEESRRDEECDHDWEPGALGPDIVEYECSKCETTKREAR